jgi:ferredoxin--NADP+ reductase
LVFNEVGKSTKQLGGLQKGEQIKDLVGPLGKPTEIKRMGTVLCLGGGVMTPSLSYVASAFKKARNKIIGVVGARTKDLLIYKKEMKAVSDEFHVTTDDGSEGETGLDFLKDVLDKKKIHHVFAMSTSEATLKTISEITRPFGIKTVVSLAPIMVDGTGMCGSCRVFVDGHMRLTCIDGPEFDGHKVDWDALIRRKRMYLPEERIASLPLDRFQRAVDGWEPLEGDAGNDKKNCNCKKHGASETPRSLDLRSRKTTPDETEMPKASQLHKSSKKG